MTRTHGEWKIGRRALHYGERTLVMGVLNVTPDSFSDGGQFLTLDGALAHAEQMIIDGAHIIDIGGESTRPGSNFVSADEELCRVIPVIERLANLPLPISIDTTKAEVARVALQAGAEIVNDISGLRFDPALAEAAAAANAGIVLMHSRGTPKDMQQIPFADDVMADVVEGLQTSLSLAEQSGISRERIAIDPGIGFGKTVQQNLELIARLDTLAGQFTDLPILIGTSRKSFLGKLLDGAPADARLYGTLATEVAAVLNGAHIVRVHDVRAAVEALTVADALHGASQ
ncbi:MAG TPA: dihydropteroate synthase [Pyrinomonadaceae bacterium]|nr:dihydropteroate synthase [Pyrinomonadaceae bacterium]